MTASPNGYSKTSIIVHWIAAIGVIALFFTHEGERGSAQQIFHVSGGAIIGIFLIWRVMRRPFSGFAPKPDQHALLNLASRFVLWGLLASILIVTLTGYFLPWSLGRPLDIFGFQISSPITGSRSLHEIMEEVHDLAGHAIIPLVVLHIAGALKHWLLDKDSVMQRMVKADLNGK